tara:strand:+ start:110 stop:322 length:213 start_codon:yes stop_codon:yes gene_type:complete
MVCLRAIEKKKTGICFKICSHATLCHLQIVQNRNCLEKHVVLIEKAAQTRYCSETDDFSALGAPTYTRQR